MNLKNKIKLKKMKYKDKMKKNIRNNIFRRNQENVIREKKV